MLFRNFYRS